MVESSIEKKQATARIEQTAQVKQTAAVGAATAKKTQVEEKVVQHEPQLDKVTIRPTATEHVHEEVQRVHVQPVIERRDVVKEEKVEMPAEQQSVTAPREVREKFAATETDIAQARSAALAAKKAGGGAGIETAVPEQRSSVFEGRQKSSELVQKEVERHIQPHIEREVHRHVDVDVTKPVTEIIHEAPIVRDLGTVRVTSEHGMEASTVGTAAFAKAAAPAPAPAPAPAFAATSAAGTQNALYKQILITAPRLTTDWSGPLTFQERPLNISVRRSLGVAGTLKSVIGMESEEDIKYIAEIEEQGFGGRKWSSERCDTRESALMDAADKAIRDLAL